MEIVKMTKEHVDEVAGIDRTCFSTPWTENDFLREINVNDLAHYFVALSGGRVVAYAGLWHIITEGHITNIAVLPGERRSGVGSKLVNALISFAEENEICGLTLEVRISNTAAQKFYAKHGFKPEGFRKQYYKDTNEDAVIMWKRICPEVII